MAPITTADLQTAGQRITAAAATTWRQLRRIPCPIWVTIAAVLLAPIGTVELTGAIAGALHSHHPIFVNPFAAVGVLEHWLSGTGVRRSAWPAEVAPALGRLHQVRATLVLALVLVGFAAVGCFAMWRSTRVERLRDVYKRRGARWAQGRELARLHVKRPTPGRLILGRRGGQLLASEANASTLIVAPSQTGKTSGLAVPAMVEWDGPILATSVKGDLLVDTLAARECKGEVKVFDPTGSTEIAGSAWSPVAAATNWSAARRLAASILQVGMRQHGGQDDSFWRQAGAAHLAPLLLAGNYLQVSTAVVLTWATSTDEEAMSEPLAALRALAADKTPGADRALHDLQVMGKADSRFRSNVIGTLSTYMDAWKEPALEAATAHDAGNGITPEWLLQGNNTLYLSAPADAQRRLRGLFVALVTEVVAAAFARSARTGRPLDPRLLLMMDEAANIAPLPNIDEIASTGPGQGVLLCTILQNLSQAEEVWGKDRADTILANHRARLFGAGIGDTSTLEYISRILGDEVRETTSITRKRAAVIDLGSRSEVLEHRALLGNHETRQIKEGHTLLIYGQLPPTQIELRPWFGDARLKRLVAGAAPRVSRPGERRGTLEVPLGRGTRRELSATLHGTAPAATPAAAVLTAVQAPASLASLAPVAKPKTKPSKPSAVAAAPPVSAEGLQEPVQLDGQLTLDQVLVTKPAPPLPAKKQVASFAAVLDVRGRLERELGRDSTAAVAALRLAQSVGELAALTGPLALVLQDADGPRNKADWTTANLLVAEADRDAIAELLLEQGAACQTITDDRGIRDRWTAVAGTRVDVLVTSEPNLLEAIAHAERVAVDGVGTLKVLELGDLELIA